MTQASDWVDYNARRFGDATALESADTGEVVSWIELDRLVAGAAGLLRERFGIAGGDRVALLADNDLRIFVLQFAAMRLGALFVPLNWRLSLRELSALCADCEPKLVVHDQAWRDQARELAAQTSAHVLSWGSPESANDLDLLVREARPVGDEGIRQLEDPTHILYTSGTTGKPKGALVTAQTLSWQALNIMETNAISGPGDRLLNPLPLFHAGGLNTLANPILMAGGCVRVLKRFDPDSCLRELSSTATPVTHFGSVPTMYQLITELPEFASADLSSLKHVQVAGGAAPRALHEAWAAKGAVLQTQYGGTEMGPNIASMPKASALSKIGSCGLPMRHTRVRLVTPDGADSDPGEIGEVWISGPSVTPGYFRAPEANAQSFAGQWFRTGDAGRFDKDGFLYLVDRYKDMYKSGGENVFPAEVEILLLEHPDISEVVVVGVPDPKWVETGMAVIVPREGKTVTVEDLTQFCAGRIARFKVPRLVRLVDSLPRNATGKVVKADIKLQYGPAAQSDA